MWGRLARALAARTLRDDSGIALVFVMLAMALLTGLGSALLMTTMIEGKISANYRDGAATFYGADAALARATQDVRAINNWSLVLDGSVSSPVVDGPLQGVRTLPDGSRIDLAEETTLMRCGKRAGCAEAETTAATADRPWGPNNPRWQVFASGTLEDMLAGSGVQSRAYIVVWVGDDASENDDDALKDGGPPAGGVGLSNPGRDVVRLRARAYGTSGTRRTVEATVSRRRTLAWREIE